MRAGTHAWQRVAGLPVFEPDGLLKEIARTIGLDGRMAEQALAEKTFKAAVDRDWEYSHTCGITAVPTFMVDGRKVVGAQPYRAIEDLVRAAGGTMRK